MSKIIVAYDEYKELLKKHIKTLEAFEALLEKEPIKGVINQSCNAVSEAREIRLKFSDKPFTKEASANITALEAKTPWLIPQTTVQLESVPLPKSELYQYIEMMQQVVKTREDHKAKFDEIDQLRQQNQTLSKEEINKLNLRPLLKEIMNCQQRIGGETGHKLAFHEDSFRSLIKPALVDINKLVDTIALSNEHSNIKESLNSGKMGMVEALKNVDVRLIKQERCMNLLPNYLKYELPPNTYFKSSDTHSRIHLRTEDHVRNLGKFFEDKDNFKDEAKDQTMKKMETLFSKVGLKIDDEKKETLYTQAKEILNDKNEVEQSRSCKF